MESPSQITSFFKIMNVPGSNQMVCPRDSCHYVRELVGKESDTVTKREGFKYLINCEKCDYTFSLHEGLLQRKFLFYKGFINSKFPDGRTIIPWNPFWNVTCTHKLCFKIGLTEKFTLYDDFFQVLDIVPYEKGTTKNITLEARRIGPTTFNILSSSDNRADLGQPAEFHLFIFGNTKNIPVWKELLGGAISLFNKKAFTSSIIQSCAALDAFMGNFLKEKIIGKEVEGKKWSNRQLEKIYFGPGRKGFTSSAEIHCKIFQNILHIELTTIECYKNYFGSNGITCGIKSLRDKLAHGDIMKFTEILTEKKWTEEEAAQWALQNIIKMIYHIRFYKPKSIAQTVPE